MTTPNHKFNARLNKLPPCPECGAAEREPCVPFRGGSQPREPHEVRWRMRNGEVFVFEAADARAARRVRAVRELAETIYGAGRSGATKGRRTSR